MIIDVLQKLKEAYGRVSPRIRRAFFLVLTTFALLIILSNFALLNIKSSENINSAEASTPDKQSVKKLHKGLNIVRRSSSVFVFTSSDKETRFYRKLWPFWVNTIDVFFESQKSATKIRDLDNPDNRDCLFKSNNIIYSCNNQSKIQVIQANSTGISADTPGTLSNITTYGSSKPYKDGMLGFGDICTGSDCEEHSEPSISFVKLLFINGGGARVLRDDIISIADNQEPLDVRNLRIIADDSGGERFLLYNSTNGKAYCYKGLDDKSPKEYSFGKDFTVGGGIPPSIFLSNNKIYSYYTKASSKDAQYEEDYLAVNLNIYNVGDEQIKLEKHLDLGLIGPHVYETGVLGGKYSYFIFNDGLLIKGFGLFGGKKVIPNISSALTVQGSVYFILDNSLYKYTNDKGAATLIRRFQNQNLTKISNLDNSTIALYGSPKNSRSTNSVYLIDLQTDRLGTELVDVMPLDPNSYPVLYSNYLNKDVYFTVYLQSKTVIDRSTGEETFDATEYEAGKNTILAKLNESGIKDINVHFSTSVPEDSVQY